MEAEARVRRIVVAAIGVAAAGAFAAAFGPAVAREGLGNAGRPAVDRGREVATKFGCFGCHGEGGLHAIKNPGSKDKEVPSWDGGTLMMFAKNRREIEEWILDGAPKRLRDDPGYRERRKMALLEMPAYRHTLSRRELEDLVAFFEAQSQAADPPDEATSKGRDLCVEHGCFGCHGSEGRGHVRNPGSLKGYIPAWTGSDFEDLVHSDAELAEWIYLGAPKRLRDNAIVQRVWAGQSVRMPAFRDILKDEDVLAICAYIKFLRSSAPTHK